jgi:hypothetical protein
LIQVNIRDSLDPHAFRNRAKQQQLQDPLGAEQEVKLLHAIHQVVRICKVFSVHIQLAEKNGQENRQSRAMIAENITAIEGKMSKSLR